MKKYINVFLSAVISLSLCACSTQNENTPAATTAPVSSETSPVSSETTPASTETTPVTSEDITQEPAVTTAQTTAESETTPNSSTADPAVFTETTVPVTTTEPKPIETTAETTVPVTTAETTPAQTETSAATTETTPETPQTEPAVIDIHDEERLSGDYIITEIFEDHFTATNIIPLPTTYVFNYVLSDEFCVGDQVAVACYGYVYDTTNNIISAAPYSVDVSVTELDPNVCYKPVIYLYPEETTDVTVTLDFDGELKCTYPAYNHGWHVTASPDGTLINKADGNEYSYLFWDGKSNAEYDFSKGFVVKGSETANFLREKLVLMGLTPREYNEFIVFWLPYMQDNAYNLITFQTDSYTDSAVLNIVPQPDSLLRVFMAYTPLSEPVEIEEQELDGFTRNGFTVVEWGGALVKSIK